MISKDQFQKELKIIIKNALREDVGDGDHSSLACIPKNAQGKAKLLVKENGIIAGVAFAKMIFDEVDVGIGGGTAEVVGNLLKTIATNAQVLCVTHQAQVASKGDQHYKVMKATEQNNTITNIETLQSEQRLQEIARMIGGIKITDQTRKHAKEMLTA